MGDNLSVAGGLLHATVWHKRLRPRENDFTYRIFNICLPVSCIKNLPSSWLFGVDKPGLYSYQQKDHCPKTGEDNYQWIQDLLRTHGLDDVDGEILLYCMPRLLGYGFNPVSFWMCLDEAGNIRAVLAEVRNTFGEWHNYLLYHEDHRPILPSDVMQSDKIFHVSPFMEVAGGYHFQFKLSDSHFTAIINYHDEKGEILKTSITGKRTSLTKGALLGAFFRYPFVTFKVIFLIHYQALRLALKKIKYHTKPKPPTKELTR